MPAKQKARKRRWMRRKPGKLEKKLGIFGNRGVAMASIALIAGIAETAWLRWFVTASLSGGVLAAFFPGAIARGDEDLSVPEPKTEEEFGARPPAN
jgi:hypothetical protein